MNYETLPTVYIRYLVPLLTYTYELIYVLYFIAFLSSRPNWLPPPAPSPVNECCPPFVPRGGHTRWEDVGAGGADSDEGTYTLVRQVQYNSSTLWIPWIPPVPEDMYTVQFIHPSWKEIERIIIRLCACIDWWRKLANICGSDVYLYTSHSNGDTVHEVPFKMMLRIIIKWTTTLSDYLWLKLWRTHISYIMFGIRHNVCLLIPIVLSEENPPNALTMQ